MLHVVKLFGWSFNSTADARVTTSPAREEFKVWPRLVLVTLETIIQTSVWLVVWLSGDPAEDAQVPALLPGLLDVELPDRDAGHGEP